MYVYIYIYIYITCIHISSRSQPYGLERVELGVTPHSNSYISVPLSFFSKGCMIAFHIIPAKSFIGEIK